MRQHSFLVIVAIVLLGNGCATVEPLTFEESLQTNRATRNDIRDWDEELLYRVELQYANTARQKLEVADLDIPPNTNIDFMVPFAIWETARGNNLSAGAAMADWFNSGLSKESRYRHYYNRGLGYMVNPNTHYFTFDERPGVATPEDVHDAWNEAHELFTSVYNRDGNCRVFGYTEEYQYARTYPKDVAGLYKDVLYLCQHPLYESKQQKVMVTAYANPFKGVRVVAGTVTQCWIPPEKGEKFRDLRECGVRLADKQRMYLTDNRFGWMELVTTPNPGTPHQLQVLVRQSDEATYLPAPELTQDYQEFMRARAY